jgi:hypothetical protein
MVKELYISCNEAGFGGTNVLAKEQRYFVFASVAVSDAEAAEIIAKACQEHGLSVAELRAPWPVGSPQGGTFIATLVKACKGRFGLAFHDKLFAFCEDLYDFSFWPLFGGHISGDMSLSAAMFACQWLEAHAGDARPAIAEFLRYRSSLEPADAPFWFNTIRPPLSGEYTEHPFEATLRLIHAYRDVIVAHNAKFWAGESRSLPWAVGHSANCYWAHMNHWGHIGRPLYVQCQDSPALRAITNKVTGEGEVDPGIIVVPGSEGRRVDWLATPRAIFADARRHPAIQLADVFARAGAGLLSGQLAEGVDALDASLSEHAIGRGFPYDIEHPKTRRAAMNGNFLLWLSARADDAGRGADQDFAALYHEIETAWQEEADSSAST